MRPRKSILAIGILSLIAVWSCSPNLGLAQDAQPQWIVVTCKPFEPGLAPLIELRKSQGFDVTLLHIENFQRDSENSSENQTEDKNREQEEVAERLRSRLLELFAQSPNDDYLLLAGNMFANEESIDADHFLIPPGRGTVARMIDRPTDWSYGCADDESMPAVPVGRFPATTLAELETMVAKTVAFEDARANGKWQNRINMIVGHPGGNTAMEKTMGEAFVKSAIAQGLDTIHPIWQVAAIADLRTSDFRLPEDKLTEFTRLLFTDDRPQLFSVFLGHSGADGFYSSGQNIFSRNEWGKLQVTHPAGVLFSCGCFGSQVKGWSGEGYSLVAVRQPAGPVASIGAVDESYAAAGQWAVDGLMTMFGNDTEPKLLADYWMATLRGIELSPMSNEMFLALDQADGSRGALTIDTQRKEHLQMWLLLGDPAMSVPVIKPGIDLVLSCRAAQSNESDGQSENKLESPEAQILVKGQLPEGVESADLVVTLNRRNNSIPIGLHKIRRRKESQQHEQIIENNQRSNDFEIDTRSVSTSTGDWQVAFELNEDFAWSSVVVRVIATTESETIIGVGELEIPANSSSKK